MHDLLHSYWLRLRGLDPVAFPRPAAGPCPQETEPAEGRFLWTPRTYDVDESCQYHRVRSFDPRRGRWLADEPLGHDPAEGDRYPYPSSPEAEPPASGTEAGVRPAEA